jgi:excisionase family DNA binding protein
MTLKNDRMLTSRQLARLLNVHINTVRRWNNQGMINAYRIGTRGDRRFDRDEVERFLAEKNNLQEIMY